MLRTRLSVRLARDPGRPPPVSEELIYVQPRARLRPLLDALAHTQPLLYLQCRLDDHVEDWPDGRFYDELSCRLEIAASRPSVSAAVHREEHRAAAQLRRRADALWQPVPGGRCGAYRAADGRQGPEPGGQRRYYLSQALPGLYRTVGRRAWTAIRHGPARVWKAERFSWWMTTLLHRFPEAAVRPEDAAGRTRLPVIFARGHRPRWRKTTSACRTD